MNIESKPITLGYDPDKCIGDFGWLWMEDAMGEQWMLAATYEDAEDDTLRVRIWSLDDGWRDDAPDWPAERFRGTPYLSLGAPACEPGAGLLVTVRLPEGASLAQCWLDPGDRADAARARVLAALNSEAADAG